MLTKITKDDWGKINWDELKHHLAATYSLIKQEIKIFLAQNPDWDADCELSDYENRIVIRFWIKVDARKKRKMLYDPLRASFFNPEEAEAVTAFMSQLLTKLDNMKYYFLPPERINRFLKDCGSEGMLKYICKVHDYEPFLK